MKRTAKGGKIAASGWSVRGKKDAHTRHGVHAGGGFKTFTLKSQKGGAQRGKRGGGEPDLPGGQTEIIEGGGKHGWLTL